MTRDSDSSVQRNSLPSLTAWLSVCLLAAAWGPPANEHMKQIWMQVGTVGLVSAMLLQMLQRARLQRKRQRKIRTQTHRLEQQLDRLTAQNVATTTSSGNAEPQASSVEELAIE